MKTKRDEIQGRLSEGIKVDMYGIADIAPRVGKIKIMLDCMSTKEEIMIAYPESTIKKSWKDDVKKWKFESKTINYSTYMSFKKINKSCDVLVLDEIHSASDAQIKAISAYIKKFKIAKVIGLSGTLSQRTKEKLYMTLKLPVLVEYSIAQAVADGIITDYKIDIYHTPLSTIKNQKIKWKGGEFMTSEKSSFDSLTRKIDNIDTIDYKTRKTLKFLRLGRMRVLKSSQAKLDLTKELIDKFKDQRALVFTGLTESADNLGIPSYHSKNKNEQAKDDFLSGKSDKLAVVNKMKAGITFPNLNVTILNSFDSNSENMAQKISRVTCMEYDNPDKVAHVAIVTSNEEIELEWLEKSLEFFDKNKITHYR